LLIVRMAGIGILLALVMFMAYWPVLMAAIHLGSALSVSPGDSSGAAALNGIAFLILQPVWRLVVYAAFLRSEIARKLMGGLAGD